MADRITERIQHNNGVFREANERIRDSADQYAHELDRIPFICECPVEDCVEVVPLTRTEYAGIRANPTHFLTAVGHEGAEAPVGEVVSRNEAYIVVAKE